jgi:hypothetical protein
LTAARLGNWPRFSLGDFMTVESMIAQENFLRQGGVLQRAVAKMRQENGDLPEFHEYPKMLRISQGFHDIERSTEDIKGRNLTWVETKEVFEEIIVQSEEEEERVLAGGKTSAAIEQERLDLLTRARAFGIKADPQWTAVRLRRELGEKLDAPEPVNDLARLEAELEGLRKIAAMQAEIEALKAQIAAKPEDVESLKADLVALGVTVDGRWSVKRLREELERATGGNHE